MLGQNMDDHECSEYFTTSIDVSMTNEIEAAIKYGTMTTMRTAQSSLRRGKQQNEKVWKKLFKKNLENFRISDFKQTLLVCMNLSRYEYTIYSQNGMF